MEKQHQYKLTTRWEGNNGTGTSHYTAYDRAHSLLVASKPTINCSSDTPFRGDAAKHNPEDFLLASLSSCHMLWYLHLCADAGVVVVDYEDDAIGILQESPSGGGHFIEVILYPKVVVVQATMIQKAIELHNKAYQYCFIANSVNFPVLHNPICTVAASL